MQYKGVRAAFMMYNQGGIMTKKEVVVLASMRLIPFPQIGRERIAVYLKKASKTASIEIPLLFPKGEIATKNNGQALHHIERIVSEGHGMVGINVTSGAQKLRFALEFFFYMNDVKVAFFEEERQNYIILNGAPRKKRNQERGIMQELYPA